MVEMSFSQKHRGAKYWHCSDYVGQAGRLSSKRVSLTKASLGEFVYNVMMCGGEIIQLWNQFGQRHGSFVVAVVAMTEEAKAEFQQRTKFILTEPPAIQLNSTQQPKAAEAALQGKDG